MEHLAQAFGLDLTKIWEICEYRQSHTQLWVHTRQRRIKFEYLELGYLPLFWLFLCFTFNFCISLQIHVKFIGKFDRKTLYRFLLLIQANLLTDHKLRLLHADGFCDVIPIFDACHIICCSFQEEISTKWDLGFSQSSKWRRLRSGIWCRVVW